MVWEDILPRINLHIYHSDITHESRMLKETLAVSKTDFFDQIILIGRWHEGVAEHEQIDDKRQIWRVKTSLGKETRSSFIKFFRYIEWLLRVFLKFSKDDVKAVNCHSIMELPLAPLFKLFGARVIYDTHELETETSSEGVYRTVSKICERLLIRFVDRVIVVNDSIANWYKDAYHLKKVYVVRNIPQQAKKGDPTTKLRNSLGIPDEHLVFIYQGALEKGRGVEILLEAFPGLSDDRHFVCMGMGTLVDKVKEVARHNSNIHFYPAVPPNLVLEYTSSADIGFSLIENTCLSYYLSLPNKIYEYIMAGLPVIASDFPEMKTLLESSGTGWAVAVDVDSVTQLIKRLTRPMIEERRQKVLQYRQTIGWHIEEQTLLAVYTGLLIDH